MTVVPGEHAGGSKAPGGLHDLAGPGRLEDQQLRQRELGVVVKGTADQQELKPQADPGQAQVLFQHNL